MKNHAFTLIELLVVVLIIGILSAIALPQYEKAVEKARMTEAMVIMRAIRDAQLRYYLANGQYANSAHMDYLDVDIPGKAATMDPSRIETKYFVYAPSDSGNNSLALAYRVNSANVSTPDDAAYLLGIYRSSPDVVRCSVIANGNATAVQKKLCQELNSRGTW